MKPTLQFSRNPYHVGVTSIVCPYVEYWWHTIIDNSIDIHLASRNTAGNGSAPIDTQPFYFPAPKYSIDELISQYEQSYVDYFEGFQLHGTGD
jgi:hypothetical protein